MANVLSIGNLRSSLTLARRLSQAGHGVCCGFDDLDPFLFESRHVRGAFHHAPLERDPDRALRQVRSFLIRNPHIDAVIPVSEIATRLFTEHRDAFEPRTRVISANSSAVRMGINKLQMFRLCDELGVPIAKREIVKDHESFLEAVRRIGLPCVLKPVDASAFLFGRKALILRSEAEVRAAVPHWPQEHRELCVQHFVDGLRHDVSFVAHEGRLLGAVDGEARRSDTADGTGYSVELVSVVPDERLRRAVERLVSRLDYTGAGAFQFMLNPSTREMTFLELNPRLSASYSMAELAGLPVSVLMLEIGLGRIPVRSRDAWDYPIGRRIVWTKGDLSGLRNEWQRGALSLPSALRWAAAIGRSALCLNHMTFDWTDPAPTLWLYLHRLLHPFGLGRLHEPELEPLPEDPGPVRDHLQVVSRMAG